MEFIELSRAAAYAELVRVMPAPVAEGTLDILGKPHPDEQRVSPEISALLQRPAGTFANWAARNRIAFG